MSDTITITPSIVEATEAVFQDLEARKVLMRVFHAHKPETVEKEGYHLTKMYGAECKGHQLISVNYNFTKPNVGIHPNAELFLVLAEDPTLYKNLYLLTAKGNVDFIYEKIKNGTLCCDDFVIIKLTYNNPSLSCFTMNAGIPHCELTDDCDDKLPPQFYVSEPLDMETTQIKLGKYNIIFKHNVG